MNCADVREYLSAYLDRQLPESESKVVIEHVEACPRCQGERTLILDMKNALRERKMPYMPADLIASIEAQTIDKSAWWEQESFQLPWLPALVGFATVAGALWLSKI